MSTFCSQRGPSLLLPSQGLAAYNVHHTFGMQLIFGKDRFFLVKIAIDLVRGLEIHATLCSPDENVAQEEGRTWRTYTFVLEKQPEG